MRRLFPTTALITALPLAMAGPSLAQDRTTLLDVLSLDLLLQNALQTGIMALRTQMDLVYEGLSVDLLTGKVAMTEVRAWPLPDWDQDGTCEITLDTLTLRSGALDEPERIRAKFQIVEAAFPISCLPPDLQGPLGAAGITALDLPRITLDLEYGLPASDAVARLHVDAESLGTLNMIAEFSYIWADGRDDIEEPVPVMFLEHGLIRFDNAGLFQQISPMLPPPLVGDGAGLFVEGALGQELLNMNRDATGTETLSADQQAFLTSLSEAWTAFLANPGSLVVETTMDGDAFLDLELFEDDPSEAFAALKPRVGVSAAAQSELIPTALLQAVLAGEAETLSAEDQKRVGIALATGVGAPRNLALGADLLRTLATGGDGDAAAALAHATATFEPREAYSWALDAGAGEAPGMVALLDRLERRLPFAEVLALQAAHATSGSLSNMALRDIRDMRAEAAMRLSGKGRARSYEDAAMWAILASAAGDAEAGDILADIEERVRLAGSAARAAWVDAEARAAAKAMEAWVERDLVSVFGR